MIADKYNLLCKIESDINEHLPVLKKYSEQCESIVEMGVRSIVSTWAFLAAKPKKMISIDIIHPSFYNADLDEVIKLCQLEGIDFKFIQQSTLDIVIDETDLLFIDTDHTYKQLKSELYLHGNKSRKFIIMHDTKVCPEMLPAIDEFLKDNKHWVFKEILRNNNGLTILERI